MKQSDSTVRRTHTNERIVTSRPAVVLLQSSVIPTRVTGSLPLLFKFREMLFTVIRFRGTFLVPVRHFMMYCVMLERSVLVAHMENTLFTLSFQINA